MHGERILIVSAQITESRGHSGSRRSIHSLLKIIGSSAKRGISDPSEIRKNAFQFIETHSNIERNYSILRAMSFWNVCVCHANPNAIGDE